MSSIVAGLLGILYTIGVKLIGYEFVTRTIIIGLKSWSETTASHHDDEVVDAIEKALRS